MDDQRTSTRCSASSRAAPRTTIKSRVPGRLSTPRPCAENGDEVAQVRRAWQVLSDPVQRQRYDEAIGAHLGALRAGREQRRRPHDDDERRRRRRRRRGARRRRTPAAPSGPRRPKPSMMRNGRVPRAARRSAAASAAHASSTRLTLVRRRGRRRRSIPARRWSTGAAIVAVLDRGSSSWSWAVVHRPDGAAPARRSGSGSPTS